MFTASHFLALDAREEASFAVTRGAGAESSQRNVGKNQARQPQAWAMSFSTCSRSSSLFLFPTLQLKGKDPRDLEEDRAANRKDLFLQWPVHWGRPNWTLQEQEVTFV